MKIYINGNCTELPNSPSEKSLTEVLTQVLPKNQQQQSFALALNGNFIGRVDYPNTQVCHNDSIDLLFPIVGG